MIQRPYHYNTHTTVTSRIIPDKTQRRHITSAFLIIFTHFMTMGISVRNPYTDYSTDINNLQ
jgi:hypothetical protein